MAETQEFYNLDDLTQGLRRDLAPGLSTRIFVGDRRERVGEMRDVHRITRVQQGTVGMMQCVVTILAAIEHELARVAEVIPAGCRQWETVAAGANGRRKDVTP